LSQRRGEVLRRPVVLESLSLGCVVRVYTAGVDPGVWHLMTGRPFMIRLMGVVDHSSGKATELPRNLRPAPAGARGAGRRTNRRSGGPGTSRRADGGVILTITRRADHGPSGRAKVSTSNSRIFENVRIGVRLKISALWIAMLFLYAYGDIFGFFRTGLIEDVIGGEISGIEITQLFLFGVSVYIAIASAMIFLSLVLKPTVNRWTNIVLPILYIVSIVVSAIGETWAYYYFLSIGESALLVLIIWYAWTWPHKEEIDTDLGQVLPKN
jgi:Family of unknown function (DUF6326)